MPVSLEVIPLISGGKVSFFSILHCLANGHKIVALANLYPSTKLDGGDDHHQPPEADQDLNSYMYQTVGHEIIPLYEQALGLPLYRQEISGIACDTEKTYQS